MEAKMKRCSKCGEEKGVGEFYNRVASRDGKASYCKPCNAEAGRIWAKNNREKVRARGQRWREANPERVREQRRRKREAKRERLRLWREKNKEKAREQYRRYREKNREKTIEANRRWREARLSEWRADKMANDPAFRAKRLFGSRFYLWFKARGLKKDSRVMAAVGCTPEELVARIESRFEEGMTWENYGTEWHIDHTIPLATAGDNVELMKKLWHWGNLRPMWAKDNLSKGAKVQKGVREHLLKAVH